MAVTSAPQAMPPQHLWEPNQRVHMSRWHYKREDTHVGSFSMFVGYLLTIFFQICSYCEFSLFYHYLLLTAALHVVDLILWSFALQLSVVIWVDFLKTYLFGKPELHEKAAGASTGINNTISSKQSTVKGCFNFLTMPSSLQSFLTVL